MSLNSNNINKQETQKRILLATLISFAFFIAYDFLYLQPKQQKQEQAIKIQKQTKQNTPSILTSSSNLAPVVKSTTTTSAPISTDIATNDIITTITTKTNIIEIDSLGRIAQVTLLGHQYKNEDGSKIQLFAKEQLRPLEIRYANRKLNEEAFKNKFIASKSSINATTSITKLLLTQKLSNGLVTKNLTIYPDGHYDIDISVPNNEQYFITPGYRPNVLVDMYADHGGLVVLNDDTLDIMFDEDLDKTKEFVGVNITSSFDRYYATILYNLNKNLAVSSMPDSNQNPQLFIHGQNNLHLTGYMGPKDHKTLKALNPRLTNVIEYGWFTFIAKPMFLLLQFVHDYVGNWGWTIVFVTILLKFLLFPLAHKGMVSMNKLKELSPKVKQIQEKYKNDKQKASSHMMELYKKEGANPMGGCLPVLLQIPVFFSIYRVLLNAIELKGSEWILWIDDLAAMDPYYVLPILMGATMFLQQKITPNTMTDPMQQKMFQFLPVIFTFFFLWFPAGLTLYWFINNLFTVAQQTYINKLFANNKAQKHKEHLEQKHHKSK